MQLDPEKLEIGLNGLEDRLNLSNSSDHFKCLAAAWILDVLSERDLLESAAAEAIREAADESWKRLTDDQRDRLIRRVT